MSTASIRVGIVGAGQLARMTHQAVVGLDVHLRLLAAAADDSAAQVCPDVTVGDWTDLETLRGFAKGCDVLTFDHELVPPAHLETLAREGHRLAPGPDAKRYAQDKGHQRQRFAGLGLPVPAHALVDSAAALERFGDEYGWPIVVKATRGGYDGRGVWVCADAGEAARVWDEAGSATELLAEEFVDIRRELAVLVARRAGGETVAYPLVETVPREGVLHELVVPAPVGSARAAAARDLGVRIADAIGAVGIVAIELFETADGLVVNELALRPHNSGHWTIECARTSQFQNHVRAVCDWPLGAPDFAAPAAVTVNVFGPADGSDPKQRLADALGVADVAVHLYGKEARPGRKLGHVTACGDDPGEVRARAHEAARRLGQEPLS